MTREELRTRVFLRAVLPLLETLAEAKPALARGLGAATIRIGVRDGAGATIWVRGAALQVRQEEAAPATVAIEFTTHAALNAFLAGRPSLPRIRGWRHPAVLLRALRLLAALRVLQPGPPPRDPAERALRVRLLLTLATTAVAELVRGGHEDALALAAHGAERVYQWSVADQGVAYLRMAAGRVKVGRGPYRRRRPFVHFQFAGADGALAVLTGRGNQVENVRSDVMRTIGSPEYVRKIALLMQKVEELLQHG